MYQDSKRKCRTIVLLIKPFVWCRSRRRRCRGLLKLPIFAEGDVNIGEYLSTRSRGKYSPKFFDPEENNCFSIIFRGEYQELQIQGLK